MTNPIRLIFACIFFAVWPLLIQGAPVDVDGDGKVGPEEIFDLLLGWDGPAVPLGNLQPWQVSGTTIFYTGGNVGIGGGASTTDRLAVTGADSIGTAVFGSVSKGPHLSHIQYGPQGDWYIRSSASAGKVILQDSGGSVGIGTTNPLAGTRFNVFTDAVGIQAMRGDSPNGNGVVGTNAMAGYGATAGVNLAAGGIGVYGEANTGLLSRGVWGRADQGSGIYGTCNSAQGTDSAGVLGRSTATNGTGVIGEANTGNSAYGVLGSSTQGYGVVGEGRIGVRGSSSSPDGAGVSGVGSNGADAGIFSGDVYVYGDLTEFKSLRTIDHPLDPANKYMSHASVDSSELKNLYDGTVVTDDQGLATVILPDWFDAFNKDLRYQLTVLDESNSNDFVQAKVIKKVEGNQFTLRTSRPNVEVSWQVTGVRKDPYAKAHPIEVEKAKPEGERGKYLTPELYGQPKEMGIHYQPEEQTASAVDSKGE